MVAATPIVELYAPQGAIVLMRPLLVHSSSPARDTSHRRVLHVEFAPLEAISPLQWHTAVPLRRAAQPTLWMRRKASPPPRTKGLQGAPDSPLTTAFPPFPHNAPPS